MFSQVWITRIWCIRVCHDLQTHTSTISYDKIINNLWNVIRYICMQCVCIYIKRCNSSFNSTHQCISSSHVFTSDIDSRFCLNNRWHEFTAIKDSLVRTVNNLHINSWIELMQHISYHSPNYKWFYWSVHHEIQWSKTKVFKSISWK